MMEDDQVQFGRLTVRVEQDGDLWHLTASSEGEATPFSSGAYPSKEKAVAALMFAKALVRQTDEQARRSDELACRLAYECGWQLYEHSIRTLEAQRTRAVALLSVTLVAAGIAASAFLAGDIARELGGVGGLGGAVFAASTLAVTAFTAAVAWPVKTNMALGPKNIIKNLVGTQQPKRTPAWVHKSLAGDLDNAFVEFSEALQVRNRCYKWSVVCAPFVLAGAGMVVLDAII